jgi:hypothetical protein
MQEIVNQSRSIDHSFSLNSTLASTSSNSIITNGKYPSNILYCPSPPATRRAPPHSTFTTASTTHKESPAAVTLV